MGKFIRYVSGDVDVDVDVLGDGRDFDVGVDADDLLGDEDDKVDGLAGVMSWQWYKVLQLFSEIVRTS